jgi:hypothetical protein
MPFLGLAPAMVSSVDSSVELIINPTFNNQTLMESAWYMSSKHDSIQITDVRFYLTDFQLKTVAGEIRSIENSNYLIDVFKPETLDILLDTTFFGRGDELSFNLGVNSAMNTSGALSGALDPSNGMFWSWQSGYINFKIEGISPSCDTRKNKFQFHIGGYKEPHKTLRRLSFTLDNQTTQIDLNLNLFFDTIELNMHNQVMVPGERANQLASVFAKTLTKIE